MKNEERLEVVVMPKRGLEAIGKLNAEMIEVYGEEGRKRKITPQFIFDFGFQVLLAMRLDERLTKEVDGALQRLRAEMEEAGYE